MAFKIKRVDGSYFHLPDSKGEQVMNKKVYSELSKDIRIAWKSVLRAMNTADNMDLNDTHEALKEIIIRLSTCLEFCETMTDMKGE
jgi:hypothetical protein